MLLICEKSRFAAFFVCMACSDKNGGMLYVAYGISVNNLSWDIDCFFYTKISPIVIL